MRRSLFNFNKTLVVAEHANGKLIPGTLSAITAAAKVGFPVTAFVAGDAVDSVAAELAKLRGVTDVVKVNNAALKNPTAPSFVPMLNKLVKDGAYTHVLAASTAFGRDVVPRLAAKLDVMPISDIMDVVAPDTFKRGTYAGNAITTVKTSDAIKLVTVRAASFDKATEGGSATVSDGAADDVSDASTKWVKDLVEVSDMVDLTAASVVVSGGRGLKNGENFKLLHDLAKPLKGAVGATRAVVDAGYVPNDMQIGQTGKVVAPALYIAVGLSGAIQHLAGMKDSKVIAAINTDPEAPIFSVADYGLKADLFEAVPAMTKLVS